ncbi:fimbrial protein pilin [Pseudomonas sp. M47T1]|nr:pilin [Pseudomonas sp. M47T1]EIK95165.1 fimbrial protein pilin [Pseudomonas sp. M47T1]
MNKSRGFTLSELMVVVAIVGLLSALALPLYSRYQARSKVSAGLSEISALKVALQINLDQGVDTASPAELSGALSSGNCSSISAIAVAATGAASISCTFTNAPATVNGQTITWTRTQASGWSCATTAPAGFAPQSCPGI